MRLISFDLSTKFIGMSTFDANGDLIATKEIKLKGDSFEERFQDAILSLATEFALVTEHTTVAMESPFVGRNGRTAMQLGKISGAFHAIAYLVIGEYPIEVTPAAGKKALTGNGSATKLEMIHWAKIRFGLDVIGEHAADSIGIGLYALGIIKQQQWEETTHGKEM